MSWIKTALGPIFQILVKFENNPHWMLQPKIFCFSFQTENIRTHMGTLWVSNFQVVLNTSYIRDHFSSVSFVFNLDAWKVVMHIRFSAGELDTSENTITLSLLKFWINWTMFKILRNLYLWFVEIINSFFMTSFNSTFN